MQSLPRFSHPYRTASLCDQCICSIDPIIPWRRLCWFEGSASALWAPLASFEHLHTFQAS